MRVQRRDLILKGMVGVVAMAVLLAVSMDGNGIDLTAFVRASQPFVLVSSSTAIAKMLASKQPTTAAVPNVAGGQSLKLQGESKLVRVQRLVAEKKKQRCSEKQIVVFPSDECSTLPKVKERDWTPKTFAGVHWTSGDVDPRMDVFPMKEAHGGYAGMSDIIYDAKDGVHPTLYKHHIGVTKAPLVGTKHAGPAPKLKSPAPRALHHSPQASSSSSSGLQPSELVRYANSVLHRAERQTDAGKKVRLLKEATDAFKAASKEEREVREQAAIERAARARARALARQSLSAGPGLNLMDAVHKIVEEEDQLQATAQGLESAEDGRAARMARDMVEVKRSLSALAQSSAPTAGGAAAAAPTAQRTAHVQTLTKTNADPYMNRNAPWGYQDPFADYNPPLDNEAQSHVDYFYNIPSRR